MKIDRVSCLSAQLDLWPSWLRQCNSYGSNNQLRKGVRNVGGNNYPEEVMRVLRVSVELEPSDASSDLFLNEYSKYDALATVFKQEDVNNFFAQQADVKYWFNKIYGIEL